MGRQFDNKAAVVTGAASGIGRAGALAFAREGAQVLVTTGSNVAGGEETVRLIKEAGGEASFLKCDVSIEDDVQAMVETCLDRYGSLDFAFNNAGVGPDGRRIPFFTMVDMPKDIWDHTLDVNLTGAFLCMKHELKHMIAQGSGVIVNTSSVHPLKPKPGSCAYNASKSGLNGITRTAALEAAPYNVRVNTIMPGPTEGTLLVDYLTAAHPERRADMEQVVPLPRLGNTGDMAQTLIWLCSDAASFITGQCLAVDGGLTAR